MCSDVNAGCFGCCCTVFVVLLLKGVHDMFCLKSLPMFVAQGFVGGCS